MQLIVPADAKEILDMIGLLVYLYEISMHKMLGSLCLSYMNLDH
jgi:hypothetical protein